VRVERIEDAEAFEGLEGAWHDLADRSPTAHLFNDFDWLHAWWSAFAGAQDRLRIYAVRDGDRLLAALPAYLPAPAGGLGAPRRLAGLFNHYLGRTDLLVEGAKPDLVRRLLAAAQDDARDWDVLELPQMPEDSQGVSAVAVVAEDLGLSVHGLRTICSPYLELTGTHDDWYAARFSGRKRQQDRRRSRQAEKRGGALELLTAPEAVRGCFERGLEVEALGWKGEQNSAMKSQPETLAFMRDVVDRFSSRGQARLVSLTVEGELAAFLLGFSHRGCLYFHKTGFDPRFDSLSPGRLVLLESIRAAFEEEGLTRYDFLGAPDPYKLQCSPTVRPHATLFLHHRGARSRLFRHVKRTFIPLAKRLGRPGEAFSVVVDR